MQSETAAFGRLFPGDVLLAIKGESVEGFSLAEATNAIAAAGGTMTLTIRRGAVERPPPPPRPGPSQGFTDPDKPPIPTNSQLAGLMRATKDAKPEKPKNQVWMT